MNRIYLIKDNFDFEKVCYATLKKVHSVSLFPRILTNIENIVFLKNFKKKADFQCFLCQNRKIFAKKVHFDDFDIGLFFFQKNKKTHLIVIDGNGFLAGNFTNNIFNYVLSLNETDFKMYKDEVDLLYKKLKRKKLLIKEI